MDRHFPKMDFFETCGSLEFSFILPPVWFPCVRGRGGGHGQQTEDMELITAVCVDHQHCIGSVQIKLGGSFGDVDGVGG